MAKRKRKVRKQTIEWGDLLPERSRFKAKHRRKGKIDFRGEMASDERAHRYPERVARREAGGVFEPLAKRGNFAMGEARRQGFFKVIGRAGGSTLDFYGKRIRASHAKHEVMPLPDDTHGTTTRRR